MRQQSNEMRISKLTIQALEHDLDEVKVLRVVGIYKIYYISLTLVHSFVVVIIPFLAQILALVYPLM